MQNLNIPSSEETGTLKIKHLKRYWKKSLAKRNGELRRDAFAEEWNTDTTLLSILGLGLEQTIKYLYINSPCFEDFEQWVVEQGGFPNPSGVKAFNLLLAAGSGETAIRQVENVYELSTEDWDFWNRNGYLVIKDAVPVADCNAVIEAMCEIMEIDLSDKSTWYQAHTLKQGIMVQLFQHKALERNRLSPKIRTVYEQLWNRRDLFVNTDRVGFNPPENESYEFPGPYLHWDVSLKQPIPFGLQGILYLSDTAENQGAFTLVPGFHNAIGRWLDSLPDGVNPRTQDLYALGTRPIAAGAGDFIVWHHALPHGSSPNTSEKPRLVQYINYHPADFESREEWI